MSWSAPFDAAVGVAHSVIEGLATVLASVVGDAAGAVSIVLFTLGVRLLLSPLSYLQIRGERRRAALAPRITELQREYRDDPAALAAETLALYRANGAGSLSGVLPALVQAPFFMIMYRVALDGPAGSLAGIPLAAHLFGGLPAFAVLLAIAAALAWWSSRRIRGSTTAGGAPFAAGGADPRNAGPVAGGATFSGGGANVRHAGPADAATSPHHAITAALPWLPFLAVVGVACLPLAGALYLVTSQACTAVERSMLTRRLRID